MEKITDCYDLICFIKEQLPDRTTVYGSLCRPNIHSMLHDLPLDIDYIGSGHVDHVEFKINYTQDDY